MTARTKHGMKAHRHTHGADAGSPHERLQRQHAQPNRPEGAPMSAASGPSAAPPPSPVPMGVQPQDNTPSMAPPGAGMGAPDSGAGDES